MSFKSETNKLMSFKKHYSDDDPSHNWDHILRVIKTCKWLAEGIDVNFRILIPAAILHDVINIPKNAENRSDASKLASNKAKKILKEYDYTDHEIQNISQVIIEHSYSANLKATSVESEILQDADKLDSMGAIGILRWASVGTKMNASFYNTHDPLAKDRELEDKKYSLDHFQTKLFKLYDRLNTKKARIEGKKRLEFMQIFYQTLCDEII